MTRRRIKSGFTLVELMVVVLIVGILATIGIVSLKEHVVSSRSIEALAMIQSIRAAEERYRAENLVYLDVTDTTNEWYPVDPASDPGRKKYAFFRSADGDALAGRWQLLNPTLFGPVEFGYKVNAGAPGEAMTPITTEGGALSWPVPVEPWYVIQARGDVDDDTKASYFVASSLRADVYRENESE